DQVAAGASELMLVAGFSGIGKTAVVNEVHKPIVRQRGYFIKGKFDQFNRNIPLSAFVQALRDLMGQLLSESHAQLQQWKHKILGAIGANGQIIIDVIPELEIIIGQQPPVPKLSGSTAQNRFTLLLKKIIQVFTTKDHPLVIFLDDLQWADSASLGLMEQMMDAASSTYLLIIGAYRDNEVFPAHPLMLTLDAIREITSSINTITLAPLSKKNIDHLVADTLDCDEIVIQPLAELVYQQAKGNPFFTTQLLSGLHEENLINFDSALGYWECDIAQVQRWMLTDDVVAFMAQRLQKLPVSTQEILKLAACVGNQFNLANLAIISEQSSTRVATVLWKALQIGLVLPNSQIYKFFQGDVKEPVNPNGSVDLTYCFLHDRVQQAAYSLIPDNQKQATHLKIGRLLLKDSSESSLEENLFDIVNHLNIGQTLITLPSQRSELAQLNLMAGQKAKSSTAYSSAITYLTQGIELLEKNHWDSQYDLSLALHEATAEATYLSGAFEQLDTIVDSTLASAKTLLDKIAIYETKIQAHMAQNQLEDAIKIGLYVLKQLDIELPQMPNDVQVLLGFAKTKLLLQGKTPKDLANLPTMTLPKKLAAMRILSSMISASFSGSPKLLPLVTFQQVCLSIRYGNMPLSAFAYAWYGAILCGVFTDIDTGYEFGQLALQVLDNFNAKDLRCRTGFTVNSFINPWKQDLSLTLPGLREAYQSGIETGDLEYAAWSALFQGMHLYWHGDELSNLSSVLQYYNEVVSQWKQTNALVYNQTYCQAVLNLTGDNSNPSILDGPYYSETEDLPVQLAAGDRTGLFLSYLQQLQLRYLFGEVSDAVETANYAKQYEDAGTALFLNIPLYLYDSLTQLATYAKATPTERRRLLRRVTKNQQKLKKWTHFAPVNCLHSWYLVEAEKCRVLNQITRAIDYYDCAIAGAKTSAYQQEEALANELAAKFYLGWGKEKVAASYLQAAYCCYAKWGAQAKLTDLKTRYPELLSPMLQQQGPSLSATETLFAAPTSITQAASTQGSSSSSTSLSASLDLATVLKASQTLSSEIELDKLLATLLQTVLKSAGADRAALLMINDGQWIVEAVATVHQPAQVQSAPLSSRADIPQTLIHTVRHSLEPLVIGDATTYPPLAADAYVLRQQPKSLLCTPILHQGKLIALLYLENRLAAEAFTSDRVELLNFLCAQAAISLENARLYQQEQEKSIRLAESEKRLQLLIQQTPIAVLEWNQAFECQFWNPSAEKMFGYRASEIIGCHLSCLIPEEHHPYVDDVVDQILAQQGGSHAINENLTKDGQRITCEWFNAPTFNAQGEVCGGISMTLDISDRKAAEAALVESERYHRRLFENSSIGLLLCQMDGQFVYANTAYADILGRTIAELPALSYWDV
ncbi:MAG: AAA family ATPase, partial [Cyanobacteria bacterium P01_C01_bin.73]